MKTFSAAAALATLLTAHGVSAHYVFQQLSVAGTEYPVFKYIRKNSNMNSPVTDLSSPDLRCNEGATGSGTETLAVKAGDSFTFSLDTPVYHQGPVSLFMSKAPGAVSAYEGEGDWFKIHDFGKPPTATATDKLGPADHFLLRRPQLQRRYRQLAHGGILHLQDPHVHRRRRVPASHLVHGHPQPLARRHPSVSNSRCPLVPISARASPTGL